MISFLLLAQLGSDLVGSQPCTPGALAIATELAAKRLASRAAGVTLGGVLSQL